MPGLLQLLYQLIVKTLVKERDGILQRYCKTKEKYIFAFVNKGTHMRKPVAATLAAIFLFIYILKGFHSHQPEATLTKHHDFANANYTVLAEKSAGCLVCEFQLAKDGLLTEPEAQRFYTIPVADATTVMLVAITPEPPLQLEGRGPPSI